MLETIWAFKIQVLPVLIALLIYEIPALIRRAKKLFYVPIYFSVYPLREINQDLSVYLAEDFFFGEGGELSEDQAESLRRKIIFTSVVSASFDAIVTPLVVGFVVALFLAPVLFKQFLVVLIIYKIIAITASIRNFHRHTIATRRNFGLLVLIYACYLGVVYQMLVTSYNWAYPFVLASDWAGLWSSLSGILFGKIIAQGLIFTTIVAIFAHYITDRKIREKNVSEIQPSSLEDK
jgi:hypothetical protein